MISMRVGVELTDGTTTTYPITPLVQVLFERQFSIGLPAIGDNPRMEQVYWLGWKSSYVGGAVVKPFDGWLETVVSIELISDEVSAAPLGDAPVPSPDS